MRVSVVGVISYDFIDLCIDYFDIFLKKIFLVVSCICYSRRNSNEIKLQNYPNTYICVSVSICFENSCFTRRKWNEKKRSIIIILFRPMYRTEIQNSAIFITIALKIKIRHKYICGIRISYVCSKSNESNLVRAINWNWNWNVSVMKGFIYRQII